MDLVVVKGGKFTFTLSGLEMSRGLRPSSKVPRNSEYLYECVGAVGEDGVLTALDSLTRIDTSAIKDAFPFPQIFVFTNVIIVCGHDKIYEWNGSSLVLKYTATSKAGMWTAVDFFDFVYLSNGVDAVARDAGSKAYAIDTDLPAASSICNYNGQILVGAPDVAGLGASMTISASSVGLTVTPVGTMTTT